MRTKRFLLTCLLLIAMSAPVLTAFAQIPVPQLVSPIVIVNTPALNARSGPGSQYTVIVTLSGGTELPVLASTADREWYLVATPVGNAWIDVDFVIPRGDFTFVPVIRLQDIQAQLAPPTPATIQMPTARQAFGAAAFAPRSNRRAVLEVLSVDLRPGPFEASGVITTLFLDPKVDYAVLGETFDSRLVEWVAIFVPGVGNGWIEKAKVRIVERELTAAELAAQASAAGAPVSSGIPIPQIELAPVIAIVNTPFVNIRTGPGARFSVISVERGGTALNVVGLAPDLVWVLVEGAFGRGWVASEFVLLRGNLNNVPTLTGVY
jgi:uncharacterized protein YraI